MAPRLKVFSWSDGFHAFTVAASSRPKALAAWGITGDIFKTGLAHEVTEGADHDAALASPGEVIERGLAIDIGKIGKAAKPKARSSAARDKASQAVTKLEQDLAALDHAQAEATADLEKRQAALDGEARRLDANHEKARKALVARLRSARAKV